MIRFLSPKQLARMKSTVFTFALCTIFALSSPPGAASPSSIVGMGVTTGTPSGDIRALRDHASEEFRVVTTDLVRDEDVDALRPVFAERAVRPFRIVVQTDVMADPSAGFLRVTKELLGKLLGY